MPLHRAMYARAGEHLFEVYHPAAACCLRLIPSDHVASQGFTEPAHGAFQLLPTLARSCRREGGDGCGSQTGMLPQESQIITEPLTEEQ